MKYKCQICGEVFEIPAGEEVICPLCFASGDVIESLRTSSQSFPSATRAQFTTSATVFTSLPQMTARRTTE